MRGNGALFRWLILVPHALALSGCGTGSPQAFQAEAKMQAGAAGTRRSTAAAAPGERAAASYARAQAYRRCAMLAEAAPSATSVGDADLSEPGARAAVSQRARDHAAQLKACQHVGEGEYAQVDQLLRQAAGGGNTDAQLELLGRRARLLLERQPAVAADARPQPLSPSDRADAEQVLADLEAMAMQGNRAAMPVLDQFVSSPLLATAEPLYGDAWRLVSQQPFGHPLPAAAPLRGEEMFEEMDAATEQQVVMLARELHASCCAH
ncbi:hypothetical protein LMG31884_43810 [Xanthomonas hydrangeae]|uniref:hypothetical protein n=1 Tax=Xanthomonas hydrangeae TaxID=2775159 RepID=UPI001962D61C|nr:hypothetical protein LMG31884_43810 [Xanthomonas hydrangeae]CAD7729669.1 hypothetical protein LMG31884_43810 [Xanthomonas hydrangeae]CAD7745007.1 hypothetical protein LMG31887_43730 [Xanthomonas hydrangeae]CAD7745010.1 hypothetical protein LMG31887_43730 [Xanthomonas hydrangeae]